MPCRTVPAADRAASGRAPVYRWRRVDTKGQWFVHAPRPRRPAVPFIEEGLHNDEPVLIAVPAPRLRLLRGHFGPGETDLLSFVPMEEMGRNPAWIIPAWADFVDARCGSGRSTPISGAVAGCG